MIEQTVFWLTMLVEKIGYFGVMLSMFIESFFVPIPSELIMPFAGFIASQGKMNLVLLIVVGGFSSYLGSLPFYFLGYLGSKGAVENFFKKYGKYFFISPTDVDKAFEVFKRHGNAIVLVGRIIPIVRSLISIPAGIAKMNFLYFSVFTVVGSLLWSGILASLGFIVGNNWSVVSQHISQYENVVLVVLIGFVIWIVISKIFKRDK